MSKCDNCGLEKETRECVIRDNKGTRYRNLCFSCIAEFQMHSFVEVKADKENLSNEVKEHLKSLTSETVENVLLTTGVSFEGYSIVEYKGLVFDETITGIGLKTAIKSIGDVFSSWTGDQMSAITDRIDELKSCAIERLKYKALSKGANAIIGIDFESTFSDASGILISINGTAVKIEKN